VIADPPQIAGPRDGRLRPVSRRRCLFLYLRLREDEVEFGRVEAGDVLTFVDFVTDYATWFSDPALNAGNGNHIYSTTAAAGEAFNGSPAGTYVAFEDLRFPNSDFNYFDQAFVFTVAAVPEPATWAMIILGFAALGLMRYRKRSRAPVNA